MCSSAPKDFTALFTVVLVVSKQMSNEELNYTVSETNLGACVDENVPRLFTKTMEDLYNKTSRPLQGFVNKSLLIPPLVKFQENFRISPKFNLATCQIEKIMCTFRAGLFCYLNRRREFVEKGRNISTEHWGNRLCKGEHRRKTFEETVQSLAQHPKIFSITRHPIDRFLSGFVDKCIVSKQSSKCFHCLHNLECFLTKLHEILVAYYTKSRTLTEIEYFYVRHFAPANWYCNLKKSYDKMLFMRYNPCNRSELADDFVAVLSQALVPLNQTNYIRKEVLRQLPKHATSNREERKDVERKLLNSPHALRFLLHIYYYDFIIFDYSFPKRIDACHVVVKGSKALQTKTNYSSPNRKLSRVVSIWYLLRARLALLFGVRR